MLDKIIHFSIHNKLVIGILTLGLVVWGGYSLTRLPIDAVPDITNNQVQVITTSPSLAAQEVERLITFPIETALATIPDVKEIRSISRFGLSVVTIVFEESVDVYWARQQVSERLPSAAEQIPAGTGRPEMAPVSTGLGEIYQYLLRAEKGYEDKFDAMELRSIQDWIVRRQLLGTSGVADVSGFGGYLKQYEIAIDQQKLKSFGISVAEVFTALQENNQNTGGAYIDKKPNAYFIRSEGLIGDLDDIRKITVRQNGNGIPVLINDLAKVRLGHAVRYGAMTRNDEGEVVGGMVLMLKGANSSEVVSNVKERIEQIRSTLPEGVTIEPFLDRTELVDSAIRTVSKNLTEGALIVIFVLVLLLGNLRAGLVVASVIPLAMLFAIAMMRLFGVSGNLMSLGAIDFGLIVDGAVIIVEATLHHIVGKRYPGRLTQAQMDAEVYESASKIRNSAAFGEIIILIVYLPILALVGIEGKMFRPMAQTVAFAILGAFILSLTYVPMVSALFLSKEPSHKPNISDRIIAFFQRAYAPALRQALRFRVPVLLGATGLFALSLWVFSNLGGEFIPQLEEGDFALETRVLTGSSLSETVDAVGQAARILLKNFPDEVAEVVGKIGASEIPTDPMPVEAADVMVILAKKDQWKVASDQKELAVKMQEVLSESIAGVTFGFQQPIQMRFNELISGVKQDVAVKIFGENLDVLATQARRVGNIAATVKGAEDLYVEEVTGLPQIVVDYDRSQLAKFGLSIEDANRTLSMAFAGSSAGLVYEGERRYDLVMRFDKEDRQSLIDVKNLLVTVPSGQQIPLEQVANVEMKTGVNQIQREDAKRRITVAFNVRGRDVESIVNELKGRIEREVELPPGYYVTYGGQFQNLQEANQRLAVAVPAALLLIFVLLYFTFNSLRQSLLILTAIPLSAIGGVLALWLRDMPFSISAGIGFIALFGVAVLNGIVLIGEFNYLRKGGLADLREVIFQGTATRLRPVLLTALVASLGFLPMALSGSAGAEVQRPLATVVIGGLVSATLLTLFVLPILYLMVEKRFGKALSPKAAALAVGLFLAFGLPNETRAQRQDLPLRPLTLREAIREAERQNPAVRSDAYRIEYQEALLGTARPLAKTDLTWQGGQYNSGRFDNSFSLIQRIPNPKIAARRSDLLREEVASAQSRLLLTKAELIREVKSAFYQWAVLEEREKLLDEEAERAAEFVKAAGVRYRTGETNQLELSTAQSQLADIRTRLLGNEAARRILRRQLSTLLGNTEGVQPRDSLPLRREMAVLLDTARVQHNPYLGYLRNQIAVNQKTTALEKAGLLPDFSLGYVNQSLAGTRNRAGTDTFGAGKRFQSFEVGLSIPIFRRDTKARVEAARIGERIAENELSQALLDLGSQLDQAVESHLLAERSLEFYENQTLPLAADIRSNAIKSYRAGEVGYVEYAQAVNRALDIQGNYLNLVNDYNQAVIRIEFLVNEQ